MKRFISILSVLMMTIFLSGTRAEDGIVIGDYTIAIAESDINSFSVMDKSDPDNHYYVYGLATANAETVCVIFSIDLPFISGTDVDLTVSEDTLGNLSLMLESLLESLLESDLVEWKQPVLSEYNGIKGEATSYLYEDMGLELELFATIQNGIVLGVCGENLAPVLNKLYHKNNDDNENKVKTVTMETSHFSVQTTLPDNYSYISQSALYGLQGEIDGLRLFCSSAAFIASPDGAPGNLTIREFTADSEDVILKPNANDIADFLKGMVPGYKDAEVEEFSLPGYSDYMGVKLSLAEEGETKVVAVGVSFDSTILHIIYVPGTGLEPLDDILKKFVYTPSVQSDMDEQTGETISNGHDPQTSEGTDSVQKRYDAQIGETVSIGHYPQTTYEGTDSTPIDWIVLDVQGDQALLISKYALDAKQYNKGEKNYTWENCTLREWLNNDFINAAFSAKEQDAILMTTCVNTDVEWDAIADADGYDPLPKSFTGIGCADTKDKIFLLSCEEASKYFTDNEARMAVPTAYARANHAAGNSEYQVDGRDTCQWWLRSPGAYEGVAAVVAPNGVRTNFYVNFVIVGVRPAFWVDLKSDVF